MIFHFQIKCDQYWPNQSSEKFGNISVVVIETLELAHYTVRTFRLCKVKHTYEETCKLQHIVIAKSRYYKEGNVQSKKRQAIRR